jgi:predicted nucleotidyltransferase
MGGLLKLRNTTDAEKQSQKAMAFSEAQALIRKLAAFVPLSEALLFGSATTGKMTPDSDFDILIVVESEQDIKAAQKIVYSKDFSKIAVDWIFKIKTDYEKRKQLGGVCFVAFNEGISLL